jgi:lauroyl/myristoyl acyltransferase
VSSVYWLARGGCALAKWTPRRARHGVGYAAGALSYAGWREKRLVTQQNMAQVTGLPVDHPRVHHLALASWYNYGRYAADFLYFPHVDSAQLERDTIDMTQGTSSWLDYVDAAFKPGCGTIMITAHFGNWDFAGAIFTRRFPLTAVAETFSDERFSTLLQNQRIEKGIGIIPMESSVRRIMRVLQQNQFVAIVADRPVSAKDGVPITFFGRKTYVPAGPAALALKTGASIMPGFVWYGPHNRCYLRTFPPIFPQEAKGKSKENAIACLTQRMYDAVEEVVREWPTQWYMFRPFWPERA